MPWATEGIKSDPASGTILADTGSVLAASLSFTIILWSNVGGHIVLEHRNSTNTGTLDSQRLQLGSYPLIAIPIYLALNQRLRIITEEDLIGDMQVSLFW